MTRKLVLASTSPRRRELLASLGFSFEIVAPLFEEKPTPLSADEEVLFFAEEKARSVMSQFPDALILSSDTLIECNEEKIGKPKDAVDATHILKKLSGRSHRVLTAVVLLDTRTGTCQKKVEEAKVQFRPMTDKQIEDYVKSGEPFGKAGAYAFQGKGGQWVESVHGEKETVIGLPLKVLKQWLS